MVIAAVVLGAAPLASVDGAAAAPKRHPPCTRAALAAGYRRGVPGAHGRVVRPWKCAGRFAAATVIVDHNALTVVFRADGKRWKVVSAEKYCEDGAVPARIWQMSCNSN